MPPKSKMLNVLFPKFELGIIKIFYQIYQLRISDSYSKKQFRLITIISKQHVGLEIHFKCF